MLVLMVDFYWPRVLVSKPEKLSTLVGLSFFWGFWLFQLYQLSRISNFSSSPSFSSSPNSVSSFILSWALLISYFKIGRAWRAQSIRRMKELTELGELEKLEKLGELGKLEIRESWESWKSWKSPVHRVSYCHKIHQLCLDDYGNLYAQIMAQVGCHYFQAVFFGMVWFCMALQSIECH